MIAIYRADETKDTQAPSTILQAVGSVTKGTKSGARFGQRKRRAQQKHSLTSKGETFIGPLIKEAHIDIQRLLEPASSQAKDLHPKQPLAFTPIVAEMRKEAPQATGGQTSLGAIGEERKIRPTSQ
nr:hypothetical protein [Tanacetum cinerariifolium]